MTLDDGKVIFFEHGYLDNKIMKAYGIRDLRY
jgi:hypothetical protein